MTEIRVIKSEAPNIFEPPVDVLYLTQYRYDEAGNRVRKVRYKYTGSTPDPEFDLSGDAPPWTMQSDEFYVRDVSGKEIAIYSGSGLTQWNIWGLDNVGKINADTTRNYYLKDHLGSIRVVLNSTNGVVSAQDYDAWGYVLENRSYNSSAIKYDFTGKERDDETSYDYFGARYYDSRIGRWGQVEPMLDKYPGISSFTYALNNLIILLDPSGTDVRAVSIEAQQMILNTLSEETRSNVKFDEQGYIDKTLINSVETSSGNFDALKQMVNDSRLFDVAISTNFDYTDENGNIKTEEFGEIYIDKTEEPSPFSPNTGEKGFYGVTLIPGDKAKGYKSTGDYVGIVVNSGLSEKGRSQIFSHEAYGHAYLYSLGKEHSHVVKTINGEWIETNETLKKQITNSIQETIKNMDGK